MKRGWLAMAFAGWAVLLFALRGTAGAGEEKGPDPLREPVQQKLVLVESKLEALRGQGATSEDLKQIDQLFRIAKGSAKREQFAEADQNLTWALQQLEKVTSRVADDTLQRIQKMDDQVRYLLDDAREYLARESPEKAWAKGKYKEALELADARNAIARKSIVAVPQKDFSSLFDPYRAELAEAVPVPATPTPEAATVAQSKNEEKYVSVILRVRGNEPKDYRAAVSLHLAGKYSEARAGYEAVLKAAPNDYKSLFNLGVLDMQLGNPGPALVSLKTAFDIGIKLDTLDIRKGNFLPEIGPLKDACQQTGNTRMAQEVQSAWTKRKEEIQEREKREREARLPKIETPTPPPAEGEGGDEDEQAGGEGADPLKKKLKGKVALARPGATPQEVTDVIGAPGEVKMKGSYTLYYYPTGTVVFVDGKVKESAPRWVDLNEIPETP